jgi:hypothetical protein
MKKLILEVLEDMADGAPAGLTLASPAYRSAIAKALLKKIKNKKGWYLDLNTLPKKKKDLGNK